MPRLSADALKLVDQFELAWQDARPAISTFLTDDIDPTIRADLLNELIQIDLEYSWRGGDKRRLEDYLAEIPDLVITPTLIAAEYVARSRFEGDVAEAEYASRFPEFTEDLPQLFSRARDTLVRSQPPVENRATTGTDLPAAGNDYELGELIGKGGMGFVYRATDTKFGRTLAVKVPRPETQSSPEMMRRFLAEAAMTGDLQHPGIPPIHDLGQLADGRVFYAMKLIDGRTFKSILADRNCAGEVSRFLEIFQHVCETVGYAHSRGYVHRDLKPENVMVGRFGEVQVMDWGVAKRLGGADNAPQENLASVNPKGETVHLSVTDTADRPTRAGEIMGTIAYMPPEQANGRIDEIDARSDVFALGSILCEIITAKPAYTGNDLLRQAQSGESAAALARLDCSSVDDALINLARSCLAKDRDGRPRDASVLAAALQDYHAGVEDRLQQERTERAAAEARATAERARRRVVVFSAVVTLLLFVGGGAGAWWYQKTAADAKARVDRAQAEIPRMLEQAVEERRAYHFDAAHTLLQEAENRLSALPDSHALRSLVKQSQTDLILVRELDRIQQKKNADTNEGFNVAFANGSSGDYSRAFRAFGIRVVKGAPKVVADQIRRSAISNEIVDALDDWAIDEEDADLQRQIHGILLLADSNEESNRLRRIGDPFDLAKTVRERDMSWPPSIALRLAVTLEDVDMAQLAIRVLRNSLSKSPTSFECHLALAQLEDPSNPRGTRIGHCLAAIAIRPKSFAAHLELGILLNKERRFARAEQVLRRAIELMPESASAAYSQLGISLSKQRRPEDAERAHQSAIKYAPSYFGVHRNFAIFLQDEGRFKEAERAYRKAIELNLFDVIARTRLGVTLQARGKKKEAERIFREVNKGWPGNAAAHRNLGILLESQRRFTEAERAFRRVIDLDRTDAYAHMDLGVCLNKQRRFREAEQAFRRAIELNPVEAESFRHLGVSLDGQGELAAAERAFRRALEISPRFATAYRSLGIVLDKQSRFAESEDAFRQAIKHRPSFAAAHNNLGNSLRKQNRFAEAERAYLASIRMDKNNPNPYANLAIVLKRMGRSAASARASRIAHELRWGRRTVIAPRP